MNHNWCCVVFVYFPKFVNESEQCLNLNVVTYWNNDAIHTAAHSGAL